MSRILVLTASDAAMLMLENRDVTSPRERGFCHRLGEEVQCVRGMPAATQVKRGITSVLVQIFRTDGRPQ